MLPSKREERNRLRRERPAHLTRVDLEHGVAVGDVTPETAVVWTRVAEPCVVHLEYDADPAFLAAERAIPAPGDPEERDGTVTFRLASLRPDTAYRYRVWAVAGGGAAELYDAPDWATVGRFTTAPRAADDAPVSFVWSGDTYGQGRAPPYQVPRRMAEMDPDFFLYLGDTIYADAPTPALPSGQPDSVHDYRAKYREIREEAHNLRDLLRSTSTVAIWDDHEVGNDWAGTSEPRLPAARQAFLEYWPIDRHPSVTGNDDNRLFRSFQWGSSLELFVLDTRQYRDDNTEPDGPHKTMLGDEQREWLETGLAGTDATFAVIASSVSVSSPSSANDARDAWADGDGPTGFEHELDGLVEFIQAAVDSTVVWLAGDRHFARVASFDLDDDGQPEMYEAMATPIGAAPRVPGPVDRTYRPTIHYEEGGKYELGEFYNFGHVEVGSDALTIAVHDKVGDRRCRVVIPADSAATPTVDTRPDSDDSSS